MSWSKWRLLAAGSIRRRTRIRSSAGTPTRRPRAPSMCTHFFFWGKSFLLRPCFIFFNLIHFVCVFRLKNNKKTIFAPMSLLQFLLFFNIISLQVGEEWDWEHSWREGRGNLLPLLQRPRRGPHTIFDVFKFIYIYYFCFIFSIIFNIDLVFHAAPLSPLLFWSRIHFLWR